MIYTTLCIPRCWMRNVNTPISQLIDVQFRNLWTVAPRPWHRPVVIWETSNERRPRVPRENDGLEDGLHSNLYYSMFFPTIPHFSPRFPIPLFVLPEVAEDQKWSKWSKLKSLEIWNSGQATASKCGRLLGGDCPHLWKVSGPGTREDTQIIATTPCWANSRRLHAQHTQPGSPNNQKYMVVSRSEESLDNNR